MTILLFKVQKLKKKLCDYVSKQRKMFFSFYHERGTKKKILSPYEEPNLRPSDSALRCSTTEPQRFHGKFIRHACVCKLSSHSRKMLSMSCSLIPEVRHTFYLLSFFISYLSGNKLRYLPQGIFKGLKQLLIL